MRRFSTLLIVLVVAGAIAYLLSHRNGPGLRSFTAPSVSIEELLTSARDYNGRVVKVSGVVMGGVGLLGLGGFILRDSSGRGEILVMVSSGIPLEGAVVSVIGRFKQAVVIGNAQYAVLVQGI